MKRHSASDWKAVTLRLLHCKVRIAGLIQLDFAKTAFIVIIIATGILWAGPPFVTDDPEPVALHHLEVYIASQIVQNELELQGTIPHLEVNFGTLPETQFHIIVPYEFSKADRGRANTGLGDVELGIKFRFLKEHQWLPQVGTFPHVLVPAGDSSVGLGTGRTQIFVPIWLQKSFGRFETYGGGGYWMSPGYTNYNFWSFGWTLQYNVVDALSAGAEIFRNTGGGQAETGFDAGIIINVSSLHHILLSAGTDIRGQNRLMTYAAYQLTL
jgi:hypothetical protein